MKKFVNKILDLVFSLDHPWIGSVVMGILLTIIVVLIFLSAQYFDTIMNFIYSIPTQVKTIFAIFVVSTIICRIELY